MPSESTVSALKHLTVAQLADRLGISDDYLRRAILSQPGGIPGMKLGDEEHAQWRIRLRDVEMWEESRIVCYDSAPKRRRAR